MVLGFLIGSFLNVCILRIPKKQSIVYPPSHCTNCNRFLKPLDLIPIFSYMLLKGRCRYCGDRVAIRYPLVELLTGIIFLSLYLKYGFSISYIFLVSLSSILICITFIDYDHQIIPDELLLLGSVLALLYKLSTYFFNGQPIQLLNDIWGLLLGGGFFFLIAVISNGGMGGGDIKMMAMLGFWFGWRNIILIALLAFIIGSILSVILLAFKLKTRKDTIPFGPFIAIATITVILYGELILGWYMKHFL
ncbi:MAG: prepilin peptidase [Thermotaleaceae bacterium]